MTKEKAPATFQTAQQEAAASPLPLPFERLFHASPVPLALSHLPDGRLLAVTDSFLAITGFQRDELIGRSATELGLWAHAEEREAFVETLGSHGVVRGHRAIFRTKAGELRPASIDADRLSVDDHSWLLAAVHDVTIQHRTEHALERQRRHTEQLLASTLDGYILADASGHILDVNQAYCELVGYPREELLGMRIEHLEAQLSPPEIRERIGRLLAQRGGRFETCHRHRDGHEVELDVSITVLDDGNEPQIAAFVRDVRERSRAEAAIRKSHEDLRSILTNIPDIVLVLDADGCYLDVFTGENELLIRPPEEMIGHSIHDLLEPEVASSIARVIRRTLASNEVQSHEYVLTSAGQQRWYSARVAPFSWRGVPCVLWMTRDVTTRRVAGEQLSYQAQLLEQISDAVISTDLDFVVRSWNHGAVTIYGYSAAEAIGQPLARLTSTTYRGSNTETARSTLLEQGAWSGEVTQCRKDGSPIEILSSVVLLRDADGNPSGAVAVNRDISERYRVREELTRQRDFAMTVMTTMGQGLTVVDADWRFEFVNPAFGRMIGYRPEELISSLPLDLIIPNEREAFRKAMAARETGAASRYQTKVRHRDGRILDLLITGVPRAGEGFRGSIAVISDITEQLRTERLERDRREVLEMVARNEPLENTLTRLITLLEDQHPGSTGIVILLEQGELLPIAAPTAPEALLAALAGLPADHTGAIGRALQGIPQEVDAPFSEDGWQPLGQVLTRHGFQRIGCHPIRSGDDRPLGLLLELQQETPVNDDTALAAVVTQLAAIAIDHHLVLQQLTFQAQHDALTGLPNRVLFEDRLGQAIALAERHDYRVAVLFIDLDRFKQINDSLGHQIGDVLLQQVAGKLSQRVRQTDTLARMGGDEFALLLSDLEGHEATTIAEAFLELFREPFTVGEHELFITASIGVSLFPFDGRDATTLLKNVDSAMYRAKAQGRNSFYTFSPEISAKARRHLALENQLRRALERAELTLVYHPRVNLQTLAPVSIEALLRWRPEGGALVPPSVFIPLAEESGLIIPIGAWVLDEACRQMAAWQAAGLAPLRVAVNVSTLQFSRFDFPEQIGAVLGRHGIMPWQLELEVTESVVMHDLEQVAGRLQELQELGLSISIDDFGTGYSSLSYLQRLPLDNLKIDRTFVEAIPERRQTANSQGVISSGQGSAAMVEAIVNLGRTLGLNVIAEGVETEAQLAFLRKVRCNEAQGFLFHRPLPADDISTLLQQRATPD